MKFCQKILLMTATMLCLTAPSQAKEKPQALVHGLFTPATAQIAQVKKRNAREHWGFTDQDFQEAAKNIPAWPEERLVALVLVPYLKTTEATVKAMYFFAESRYDHPPIGGVHMWMFGEGIRPLGGIEPSRGLRWEVIDFGSFVGEDPRKIRQTHKVPSAGVWAAVALHPQWVLAMKHDTEPAKATIADEDVILEPGEIPYVWIPGYELEAEKFSGEQDVGWDYVLCVGRYVDAPMLTHGRCNDCGGSPVRAVPVIVETL